MTEDPRAQETASALQETMLDILRRRAAFEGLEYQAIVAKAPHSQVIDIVANDYVRAQLADLRKFFDNDPKDLAHNVRYLTGLIGPGPVKDKHDALFARWQASYQATANKYFMHAERGYTPPSGIPGTELNLFINDTNLFLDELVGGVFTAGYSVGHIARDHNGEYFSELKAEAVEFYKGLGSA